jgi:hypothetical protein
MRLQKKPTVSNHFPSGLIEVKARSLWKNDPRKDTKPKTVSAHFVSLRGSVLLEKSINKAQSRRAPT